MKKLISLIFVSVVLSFYLGCYSDSSKDTSTETPKGNLEDYTIMVDPIPIGIPPIIDPFIENPEEIIIIEPIVIIDEPEEIIFPPFIPDYLDPIVIDDPIVVVDPVVDPIVVVDDPVVDDPVVDDPIVIDPVVDPPVIVVDPPVVDPPVVIDPVNPVITTVNIKEIIPIPYVDVEFYYIIKSNKTVLYFKNTTFTEIVGTYVNITETYSDGVLINVDYSNPITYVFEDFFSLGPSSSKALYFTFEGKNYQQALGIVSEIEALPTRPSKLIRTTYGIPTNNSYVTSIFVNSDSTSGIGRKMLSGGYSNTTKAILINDHIKTICTFMYLGSWMSNKSGLIFNVARPLNNDLIFEKGLYIFMDDYSHFSIPFKIQEEGTMW